MQLSKKTLKQLKPQPGLVLPDENLFALPEKVLQFGTGVLLRGLPDYFIDKANRQGIFNGRVVVIKSTSQGSSDAFGQQDGLYMQYVRGIEDGAMTEEAIVNSSISRVLSAKDEWTAVLACAKDQNIQVVISNTTEVGIVLAEGDKVSDNSPSSFPGKLLAILYERFKAFKGSSESGLVIVPTELIIDNGNKLRDIVLDLAKRNGLEEAFVNWVKKENHFCNSLVDRIVPGKLPPAEYKQATEKFGFEDELMIMSEPFRLWAIESGEKKVKEVLSFANVDNGVVITPDIEKFRELKLRLLNGTHTFSCGLAYMAGFDIVKEAMTDEELSSYMRRLMMLEIAPVLDSNGISYNEACAFANQVVDRFRNPSLDHKWLSITMNYTSKMKLRNIPLLLKHYQNKPGTVPMAMALGFAAYLWFMKSTAGAQGQFEGKRDGSSYIIQDDKAEYIAKKWQANDEAGVVKDVLGDKELWSADLSKLEGFAEAVTWYLQSFAQRGVKATLADLEIKTTA